MPQLQPKYRNSAAFYDVDGTLIRINIVHAFAFYASRQASLLDSAARTVVPTRLITIPLHCAVHPEPNRRTLRLARAMLGKGGLIRGRRLPAVELFGHRAVKNRPVWPRRANPSFS